MNGRADEKPISGPELPSRPRSSFLGLTRNDQTAVVALTVLCIIVVWIRSTEWSAWSSHAGSLSQAIDSQLDINSATEAELDLLEGIGPKTAAKLVQDREARGPFSSIDNLQRVKGIGPKTVEKNRQHLRVSTTPSPESPTRSDP